MEQPSIFISATSADLRTARDLVAKLLTSLGYTPVWQDTAPTDAGLLSEVLRKWIEPCAAVIQLVGSRYGAEPRQADPEFGRASYTQLEALYAEKLGKKVIYIFLPTDFPTDSCDPESEDKANLQLAYRQRLKESGILRHNAATPLELENRILRIRDDLATLRAALLKSRRRARIASLAFGLLLVGIAFGVWRLRRASEEQGQALREVRNSQDTQKEYLQKQEKTNVRIETKLDEIRLLPANLRADRLGAALAAANASELLLLYQAGITIPEIQNALARKSEGAEATMAESFFQASRNNPEALDWFRQILKDGLDPNMLIPDRYYERRAIVSQALKDGNAEAAIALLQAGASPHPYQGIWETRYAVPTFLFPYAVLMDNDKLDATEKKKVAAAMRDAGAVMTRFQPGVINIQAPMGGGVSRHLEAVEDVFKRAPEMFGFELQESPSLAEQPDPPIARHQLKAAGPWQQFFREMPLHLASDTSEGPRWIDVRNFLGVYAERAYFIGVAAQPSEEYALIEVSKDHRSWTLYLFTRYHGKGFAKNDRGEVTQEYDVPFWRRFDFTYFPERQEMELDRHYKYKATRGS